MNGLLLLTSTPFDPPDFTPFWQRYFASTHEMVMVLSAIGGVVAVILIWAIFFRKRKDEDSRRYSYQREGAGSSGPVPQKPAPASGPDNQPSQGKRRRRRRRRPHRPRNPTLAEAGGLPPVRTETFTDDPP
jgi:hypothetical protein